MKLPVLVFVVALAAFPLAAQQAAKPAQNNDKLPPISYVCPMPQDADIVEDKPGKCPRCGMTLEAVRLDSVWTCPVHAAVIKDQPGKCPIDQRDLVQVTMALSWTCPNTNVNATNPGVCADGSPMVKKYTPRPHGNHNPQHGGQFFMAADNWHHLEGTLPRAGVFRVYLYDDFTKPLARAQVRKVTGQVVVQATDPATHAAKDVASFPLTPVPNGRYLEAKVGKVAFPAQMAAKVKFDATTRENRFDFTFPGYTMDPVAAPTPTMTSTAPAPAAPASTSATPAATPAAPVPTSAPTSPAAAPITAAPASTATGVDPGLIPLPIPDTVPEMLAQLSQRTVQIKRFIDQGQFGSVYVPAFQAKDLALAIDEHKNELPPDRLKVVAPAIKRLVRSAWLLDAFGDLGNKDQITQAYSQFASAAKEVEAAFPGKP